MKKIICIGSVTKDVFVLLKKSRILPGSTQTEKELMAFEFGAKEYAEGVTEKLGGNGANAAAGLALFGYRTFLFAAIGKDETGKWIEKKLAKFKIKKNYLQKKSGFQSESSVIVADLEKVDHIILRTGGSAVAFDYEKAIKNFKEKVDFITLASQKENWQNNFKLIKNFAKRKGARLAINPSGYQIAKTPKELVGVLGEFELVFLNRDEALELVEKVNGKAKDDPVELIKELINLGAKKVIVTDGPGGAYVGADQNFWFIPTPKGRKYETVGAGDAFLSGFVAGFLETGDLKKALSFGMASSSSVVAEVGATEGLLKKKELESEAEKLISTIQKR